MPSVGKDGKYDCGFLDSAGKFVGLMCARDKNDNIIYKESTDDALSQQYFAGQAGYPNLKPSMEIQRGQVDFSRGYGQEYFADMQKYYTTTNVDARFRNMVICGPKSTSIAMPASAYAALTITDGNLEVWTDANTLTNWTEDLAGGTLTRTTTPVAQGTYSAAIATNGATSAIYQDAVTWNNSFRGKAVSASCLVRLVDKTKVIATIRIDDGVGTTDATYSALDATWARITVNRTLNAAATRLRVILRAEYIAAADSTAYFDQVTVGSTCITNPVCTADFNATKYFAFGSALYKLNGTGDGFTSVGDVKFPITWLSSMGNYLGISCGTDAPYAYMSTAEAITVSTQVYGTAYYMSMVGDVPYKITRPYTEKTAVGNDITNAGSWATALTVGSGSQNITSPVLDLGGTPIVDKQDMPYYVDTSGIVQTLAPELVAESSATSGKNSIVWQGSLYTQRGTQALYEYDGVSESLTDISPSKYITNSSDYDGQIQALASDAQYLYAIMDNGTKVDILAGRWERFESIVAWVWHPISEITLTGCEFAHSSTIYARRLWLLSTSSSDSITYIPLPSAYGNITADTTYSFLTGGNIVTSWHHADFIADKKAWYRLTLAMSGTSSTVYWRAYYQKLGDTVWTEISPTDKFKTSPTTTAYLPVDVSSNYPQSTMLRLKFEPVTGATSSTPVLLYYDLRAVWYAPLKKVIETTVKVSDKLLLKNGQVDDTQNALSTRTALDELANPTTAWPRAFYPPYYEAASDTKYVKLLSPVEQTVVRNEKTKNIEEYYKLTMLVIEGVS
jgi:hypothetical protein